MILLFTDFGPGGSYLGEMRAVLLRCAPEVPVVSLVDDAPACRPDLAGHLLAALLPTARPGDVVLAVVDPGVGGARAPIALLADGVWLVGPDNGLLEPALRRSRIIKGHRIAWRPAALSASFHGRDLFAPIAARLARGDRSGLEPAPPTRFGAAPDELAAVIQVDRYGNLITGLRAALLGEDDRLLAAGRVIERARTFGDVPAGALFWYTNSSGLAEIAANRASAARLLGLAAGDPVRIAGRVASPGLAP